jgi:uncharacterized protein YegJ (DUF2314 family)
MLPVHRRDPQAALRQALQHYPDLKLVAEIPKDPHEMNVSGRVQKNIHKEYAPPDLHLLQYFGRGTSREQAQELQKSEEAFILEFAHPKTNVWTALRCANSLIEDIARVTGGLIWDEETREIFSPDAWHEKRQSSWTGEVPNISDQVTIHAYKDGEFTRAITLGMDKVGLPDVVVSDFPWSDENQVGNLINIFNQSMAEGATFDKPANFKINLRVIKNSTIRERQLKNLKPNATGWGCLSLKQGVAEEGDPENRLVLLAFDRYAGDDFHAKRDQMLSSFFGFSDSWTKVEHDNQELLEASEKAREKLPELRMAFNAGLKPGEFILLKAPFSTSDGGTEWMWLEVSHWEGNRIKGLLQNDPLEVPDLHAGQIVEVRGEDVFDYIRQYPDEHREGNTTGEIIKKIQQAPDTVIDSPKQQEIRRICGDD